MHNTLNLKNLSELKQQLSLGFATAFMLLDSVVIHNFNQCLYWHNCVEIPPPHTHTHTHTYTCTTHAYDTQVVLQLLKMCDKSNVLMPPAKYLLTQVEGLSPFPNLNDAHKSLSLFALLVRTTTRYLQGRSALAHVHVAKSALHLRQSFEAWE